MAEVLGYNALEAIDARYFSRLFSSMRNHMFDQEVTKKVIEIRKAHSIQLPDAIIAATAVVNNLTLWTHNTHDFSNIEGLQLFDPLQDYLM
jgi:predicted nucleic acid-binding protein